MADEYRRMRQLTGTSAEWAASGVIIGDAEIAVERTANKSKIKLGDGISTFSQLPYLDVGDSGAGNVTVNAVPKGSGVGGLVNSLMVDDGTLVTVSGSFRITNALTVAGTSTFTGAVTANNLSSSTQPPGTNNLRVATTGFVKQAIDDGLVVGANSRVAKVGDTMTGKLTIAAGGLSVTGDSTFINKVSGPTAAPGTSNTQLATTAFVSNFAANIGSNYVAKTGDTMLGGLIINHAAGLTAPLVTTTNFVATGVARAVTLPAGTNDTQIATTAFVTAAVAGDTGGTGVGPIPPHTYLGNENDVDANPTAYPIDFARLPDDNNFTGNMNYFANALNVYGSNSALWFSNTDSVDNYGDRGGIYHDETDLEIQSRGAGGGVNVRLSRGTGGEFRVWGGNAIIEDGNIHAYRLTNGEPLISLYDWNATHNPDIAFYTADTLGVQTQLAKIEAVPAALLDGTPAEHDAAVVFKVAQDGLIEERARVTGRGVEVAPDPYWDTWDGNTSVPTKHDIYEKIESLPLPASLPPGAVMFGDVTGAPTYDNAQFHWDDTNNRLGIGTSSPTVALDVRGKVNVTDAPYDISWDGDISVPTKNAVYDKIQSVIISGGGIGDAPATGQIYGRKDNAWTPVPGGASYTSGGLTFGSAVGVLTQDAANLFWDDANNRLGVGTATPAAQLHVAGEIHSAGASAMFQWWNAAHTTRFSYIYNDGASWGFTNEGTGNITFNCAGGDIGFITSGAPVMNIKAGGNVGIGISSPTYKLHVEDSGLYINRTNYSAGKSAAGLRVNLNSQAGGLFVFGYNGEANISHNSEYISETGFVARHTSASSHQMLQGGHIFYGNTGLTLDNAFTPVERMRIDPSGNVGVGTATPQTPFHVAGSVRIGSATEPANYNLTIEPYVVAAGAVGYNFKTHDVTYGDRTPVVLHPNGNVGIGTTIVDATAKLDVAGTVRVSYGGSGEVRLEPGGPTQTGYVTFYSPAASGSVRRGYVGFVADAAASSISYVNENGGGHAFTGYISSTAHIQSSNGFTSYAGANLFINPTGPQLGLTTSKARGNGDCFIAFNDPSARKGFVGYYPGSEIMYIANEQGSPITFQSNGFNTMHVGPNNSVGIGMAAPSSPYTLGVGGMTYSYGGYQTGSASDVGAGAIGYSIPHTGDAFSIGRTGPTFATQFGWMGPNQNYIYSNAEVRIGSSSSYVGLMAGTPGSIVLGGATGSIVGIQFHEGYNVMKANVFYHPPTASFYHDADNHLLRHSNGTAYLQMNASAANFQVPVNSTGNIAASGTGVASLEASGDIRCHRGNDTGVIFLGNGGNHYLYWNTANYELANGALSVPAGGISASGNIAAYSDERLKTNWRDARPDFVARLAEVKHGIYDRTDIDETQVGVGAQSLQKVLPEAVGEQDGNLTINYGGAAMLSAVELAKKVVVLESMVEALEARLAAAGL